METKWIEDFLSVAETLNFSRAAKLRNMTQPAFSRRIRALESWLGAELFDRAVYPTRLTPAGETFLVHARDMLAQAIQSRSVLRGQAADVQSVVSFAMPHTLSLTYFPQWLGGVESSVGMLVVRMVATNVHDSVMELVGGNCDLLMCYHHAFQSVELDSQRYEGLKLGHEFIRPYARADAFGNPVHVLPGSAAKPVPFLSYSSSASLGRIVDKLLGDGPAPVHLFRRFEGDLAEGLKTMAVHGHGVAWLPESAARREVKDGVLTLAIESSGEGEGEGEVPGAAAWCGVMDIRIYRDRGNKRPAVERIWNHLLRLQS
ncbi:LysR family transcriptional regulator [Noviherbaspirillum sp. CPCC 100848]|uniref:LysR family transcriptional regulator n=1 Tax=Noviherbaspirillum album TaxID=3080276 RepID=A0ABU6J8G5_9BURK|nr:LysR family transcriptional regulator [Noviherbaspirillum sp. CPCC 100848]MEC4719934.1 LysR family transcriptional regulator [Noviherbaspirillum sp. CPCC 100848]